MIRTFLIYGMLDKCLDLLFDRIEVVLTPFDGYRVGDKFSRIIDNGSMRSKGGRITRCGKAISMHAILHDCSIMNIRYDQIVLMVNKIEYVYVFNDHVDAAKFVSESHTDSWSVSDNGCEVSFFKPSTCVYINPDTFVGMEKIK